MGAHAKHHDIAEDKMIEFETAVMPIPQFDPSDPQMISQGPSVCVFNKRDPQEVLASWLFAQFLLTNDVQIAYSETEGYVPVTSKAQESAEYVDYLSRAGEDNDLYYDVKIEAAKLLLNNVGSTFITPVWSGSASLRDAAGSLVESVVKSVRRREKIDDAYYKKLYSDTASLYRLNEGRRGDADSSDLGPLPGTAVALIAALAAAWVILTALFIAGKIRAHRAEQGKK